MRYTLSLLKSYDPKTHYKFTLIDLSYINTCQVWSINIVFLNLFFKVLKVKKRNYKFVVLENIETKSRFWTMNTKNNTHSINGELWYKEIAFTDDPQEAIEITKN